MDAGYTMRNKNDRNRAQNRTNRHRHTNGALNQEAKAVIRAMPNRHKGHIQVIKLTFSFIPYFSITLAILMRHWYHTNLFGKCSF